jgi:hypothetical protein
MSENIEAKIGNLNVRYLKKYENLWRHSALSERQEVLSLC